METSAVPVIARTGLPYPFRIAMSSSDEWEPCSLSHLAFILAPLKNTLSASVPLHFANRASTFAQFFSASEAPLRSSPFRPFVPPASSATSRF